MECMEEAGVNFDNAKAIKLVDDLGSQTSLSQGYAIAIGLLLNYFYANQEIQEIVKQLNAMRDKLKIQ